MRSISVREWLGEIYASGDLEVGFVGRRAMREGAEAHQRYQASVHPPDETEVHLTLEDPRGLKLIGRADVVRRAEGVVIEELKTTAKDPLALETPQLLHRYQALLYGLMLSEAEDLEVLTIRVIYLEREGLGQKTFEERISRAELIAFYEQSFARYARTLEREQDYAARKERLLEELPFCYPDYRPNQRHMAVQVYRTIEAGQVMYLQAPTGTGKTVAVLFPGLKAIGAGKTDKLFYLTSKSATKAVALEGLKDLTRDVRTVVFTAKEKRCPREEVDCSPEVCPLAAGFYDRLGPCLDEILAAERIFDDETIARYAEAHRICPFELGLELSTRSDVLIGDVNYAFDPRVNIRRIMEERGERVSLLVDEAHNLVGRARMMFSSTLSEEELMVFKKEIADKKIRRMIDRILATMEELEAHDGSYERVEPVDALIERIERERMRLEDWLETHRESPDQPVVLELLFSLVAVTRIYEIYTEGHRSYLTRTEEGLLHEQVALDPSHALAPILEGAQGSVLFSATLAPLAYFRELLYKEEAQALAYPSPFSEERMAVLYDGEVSTRYRDREATLEGIADRLRTFVSARAGNYLIYVPSFAYMERLEFLLEDLGILYQRRGMSEKERLSFLDAFRDESPVVGMAVSGGVFSEGIDLVGRHLEGVAIVGIGLPAFSEENERIRRYFGPAGFDFAYRFPALHGVMQAGGRLIRRPSDIGVLYLIGDRLNLEVNRRWLPTGWGRRAVRRENLDQVLRETWHALENLV
jgi:DNA excision repair protein ERCC-2